MAGPTITPQAPVPPGEPARIDPPDRGRPDARRRPPRPPRAPGAAEEVEPPPPGHVDVIA